jgi:hypothetical protein
LLLDGFDKPGEVALSPVEEECNPVEEKGFGSQFYNFRSLAVNVDDRFAKKNDGHAENKGGCLRKLNH